MEERTVTSPLSSFSSISSTVILEFGSTILRFLNRAFLFLLLNSTWMLLYSVQMSKNLWETVCSWVFLILNSLFLNSGGVEDSFFFSSFSDFCSFFAQRLILLYEGTLLPNLLLSFCLRWLIQDFVVQSFQFVDIFSYSRDPLIELLDSCEEILQCLILRLL